MITIPVTLGWFIAAVVIVVFTASFLGVLCGNHLEDRNRKDMKARESAVREAEATIADRMFTLDERADAVLEAEYALGRKAHDTATQAKAALYQATNDDTQIAMPRLEL